MARYTFWLTIFTAVLGAATIGLYILAWKQGRQVEREFIATFQPKLVLREMVWRDEDSLERPVGVVTAVLSNYGGSDATIVESRVTTHFRTRTDAIQPLHSFGDVALLPPGTVIRAGEAHPLTITDDSIVSALSAAVDRARRISSSDRHEIVVGYIVFADKERIPYRHGFGREFDVLTGRLLTIGDQDFEYKNYV